MSSLNFNTWRLTAATSLTDDQLIYIECCIDSSSSKFRQEVNASFSCIRKSLPSWIQMAVSFNMFTALSLFNVSINYCNFKPTFNLYHTSYNSTEQSLSWEADSHSAGQGNPHLLWNLKVLTIFTIAYHWYWFSVSSIHSTSSHPTSLRFILILSSQLCLHLLGCPFKFFN